MCYILYKWHLNPRVVVINWNGEKNTLLKFTITYLSVPYYIDRQLNQKQIQHHQMIFTSLKFYNSVTIICNAHGWGRPLKI